MVNPTNSVEACYQRARKLMHGFWTNELALNTTIFPVWISGSDCFWYERKFRDGKAATAIVEKQYRLVDTKAKTNETAFDHAALADALAKATRESVDAANLPLTDAELQLNPTTIHFTAFNRRWKFEEAKGTCSEVGQPSSKDEVISPCGKYVAIRRDYNLWLRNISTGEEKALTTDGELYSEYADESPAWGMVRGGYAAQLVWSPDSKRIFAVQRDAREVQSIPVVHHVPQEGSIRPYVELLKMALPGDEHIETNRLVVINVETGKNQPANYPQLPTTRNAWGFFDSGLGWWGKDSRLAYFVDVDRWYKYARVVEFNTDTGNCRVLFEETSGTHINLMLNQDAHPSYLPLPESDEILWYSERTGWAHYYLYCLKTGKLKNTVTSGPGLARNIVRYIPERREVFVQMACRVAGRDPYYRDLTRVNIDTGEMRTLVSSDHEYIVVSRSGEWTRMGLDMVGCLSGSFGVSDSGDLAVVTRTRADEIPVSYLIDRDGNHVMELETADISALPEGWQWPEPVALKAADGKTDIYGLVFRPSDFDPDKSYPVISHGFNQPEISWVSKGAFATGIIAGISYWDAAAIAELGFIVVQIDGRGSPERQKAFFDESYGWFEGASHIDDHVAGIKQLAERYPYMDLTRVGVAAPYGGSGALQGLLKHPDFFKVAIVQMHHDRRFMSGPMQGDKYEGPGVLKGEYEYPEDYIDRLQGKLLLMIGMLDACTLPAATFRLVDALQKANKDFDMIMLPNLGHGSGYGGDYLVRRAWDYLVRNLRGVEPPGGFKL